MLVRMFRKFKVSSDWFGPVKTDLVDDESVTQNSFIKENMNLFSNKAELNKKTHRRGRSTCDLCDVLINRQS